MQKIKYKIILPASSNTEPTEIEISAAKLLANYFRANVEFIPRTSTKTADFLIQNTVWELKSPTGKGKRNIQHQFSRAMLQSKNIIIDAR
ncbi:hypothetical protein IJH19_00650 [Candidatus Saccharibacteria bacterium]|nr:hypothetical protein [Candidatus Saccharibacteria bacterium]